MPDQDEEFFRWHPDRFARIRKPSLEKHTDKQRAVFYLSESEMQFRHLGPHDKSRRRIICWRTPKDHPTHPNHILKIPYLLFGDETVEDRDDILLLIIHAEMLKASQ